MQVIIYGVLGLFAGSFVNALVWRLRHKKDFVRGRSQCPNCHKKLSAAELVPVISWLWLRGHCRHCRKPISLQYPLVELATGLVFAASYYFWPHALITVSDKLLLASWLAAAVGLMALVVYDLKYLILPNKIIYPALLVAVLGRAVYIAGQTGNRTDMLLDWLLAVTVAAGIFWLLFHTSGGRWIGYGDVRLGLVTGTILADPALSLLMIFLASLIGSAAAIGLIAAGKAKITSKLAFGPFLICGAFASLLFGGQLIDWYKSLL